MRVGSGKTLEVRALYLSPLFFAFLIPACVVYDDSLVGDDGSVSTGGSNSNSGGSSSGGSTPTGGVQSTGGSNETGGDGGDGGDDSGGGTGGTGGTTAEIDLVDDLEQGPVYANFPFAGGWDRYIDATSGTWAAVDVEGMVEESPDGPGNDAFHVKATGFSETSWGLGVYITLNQPSTIEPIDISAYSKLILRARGVGAVRTLRIAFEDFESRSAPCPGTDCVPHAPAPQRLIPAGAWQELEIPLDTIVRTPAFDKTKVYAIHFTMDPPSAGDVEFWLDDLAFEK